MTEYSTNLILVVFFFQPEFQAEPEDRVRI